MPVWDVKCTKCGKVMEQICVHSDDLQPCIYCKGECKKIVGDTPPGFRLVYNNKTDMVDWEGNKSRYWDEYKKQKSQGKDVRIPEHDGETR